MDATKYEAYLQILKGEMLPALGCTEPGAVAFTAAKAVSVLGKKPDRMRVNSSGNIVKNVKGVVVPNSGGLRGIAPAAILGALVAKPELELEVLSAVTQKEIDEATKLLDTDYCESTLEEGEGNLYVEVEVFAGEESAKTIIKKTHTNIELVEKNGEVLQQGSADEDAIDLDALKSKMNLKDIYEFSMSCDIADVKETLDRAIEYNTAIADEGLKGGYGTDVGKTLIDTYGDESVYVRLKAKAAAGSDARMAGSLMPVVINSGSGNQGIAINASITEYARGTGASEEQLYRALLLGNLTSIHIKRHIGPLSAFCGATNSACGVSVAITYLAGGTYEEMCMALTNTIGDVSGIICDGAKASCAAKLASALDSAVRGHKMAMAGKVFEPGEGLVTDDIEKTIAQVGYIGRVGMAQTDIECLHVMLGDRDIGM